MVMQCSIIMNSWCLRCVLPRCLNCCPEYKNTCVTSKSSILSIFLLSWSSSKPFMYGAVHWSWTICMFWCPEQLSSSMAGRNAVSYKYKELVCDQVIWSLRWKLLLFSFPACYFIINEQWIRVCCIWMTCCLLLSLE